jgi:FlaA1/EpsC-like NDP-sugar epimerase
MTIEEAVLLILHAEVLEGQGEVYILDMGEPVKILDLAKQMIALKDGGDRKSEGGETGFSNSPINHSTTQPLSEKGIRIVGLRPGERIHERLHTPEEKLTTTPVPKVNKLSGTLAVTGLAEKLAELTEAVDARDLENIRKLLLRKA